jgi:hypothetical protein
MAARVLKTPLATKGPNGVRRREVNRLDGERALILRHCSAQQGAAHVTYPGVKAHAGAAARPLAAANQQGERVQ